MNTIGSVHVEEQELPYQDKLDPWSSHSIIKELLQAFPHGTRVLDIGTASGTIGRMCSGHGFLLHGIEPVAEWAEVSRQYYDRILNQDLSHTDDEFLKDHQVIICADVLEHMPDPEVQLFRLVNLQAPGTTFIISLPNIANLWVRMHLLFGNFNYAERGILDKTHLRFYTRKTAVNMLTAAGLQVQQIIPTPIPLNFVNPFFQRSNPGRTLHRILAVFTRALPLLLGYQFVFWAQKEQVLIQ